MAKEKQKGAKNNKVKTSDDVSKLFPPYLKGKSLKRDKNKFSLSYYNREYYYNNLEKYLKERNYRYLSAALKSNDYCLWYSRAEFDNFEKKYYKTIKIKKNKRIEFIHKYDSRIKKLPDYFIVWKSIIHLFNYVNWVGNGNYSYKDEKNLHEAQKFLNNITPTLSIRNETFIFGTPDFIVHKKTKSGYKTTYSNPKYFYDWFSTIEKICKENSKKYQSSHEINHKFIINLKKYLNLIEKIEIDFDNLGNKLDVSRLIAINHVSLCKKKLDLLKQKKTKTILDDEAIKELERFINPGKNKDGRSKKSMTAKHVYEDIYLNAKKHL